MDGDRIRLGRALVRTTGPLVATDHNGNLVAVWPYGPGYAPHALILGTTGGGKTTLLRYMITDLVRTPGPKALSLADGKGANSLLMFSYQPGVAVIANAPDPASGGPDPIVGVVRGFHEQVQTRYAAFSAAKLDALANRSRVAFAPPPLLALVLDEYMDWVLGLAPKLRGEMLTRLTRIGQVGREVNCRLWLAMQAPYAKSVETGLPGLLKMQLKARIAATGMMGMDGLEARMAFDDADAGDRIERYGDQADLAGQARKGLGMIRVARREVAFKTPFLADPLHWETTDAQREAAWGLLPYRPTQEELDRLREAA